MPAKGKTRSGEPGGSQGSQVRQGKKIRASTLTATGEQPGMTVCMSSGVQPGMRLAIAARVSSSILP